MSGSVHVTFVTIVVTIFVHKTNNLEFLCFVIIKTMKNNLVSRGALGISDWGPVLSGVPQGTVLGPLLFSLYINNITEDMNSELRLFADDCVCYP